MQVAKTTLATLLSLCLLAAQASDTRLTIAPNQLPQPLLEQYAKNRPDLGRNGHCAAAFDSRTDGMKMAMSCAIYVRLSAQGERLAVSLCNERAKLLKIKAPCALIVEE
jgi:hypothetical protein